ncbi:MULTISPECIES: hypothetical protein [Rhodococcus]|nr:MULTISPECIES: hypothetical protein [Rhodococcus]AWG97165.1 hypothetical protein DCN13_00455 [Rhodococcus ruber]MCD2119039.1 hypothetical protein [Rhodococcus pyridinivorans]MCZ4649324.1 hypothetical protein [Rhodococcus pyridinivorans]MDJ0482303.1 hypothetical protein [Rhodococcus pyridinivorans]QRE79242.1 hypothetical protein F1734_02510 [Rhodococcus ruber]
MFEKQPDYPCAVTNSSSADPTAIERAFRWVRQRKQPGQKILLWTPQKSNIRNDRQVEAISRHPDVLVGTSRGRFSSGWYEGPVLGMWQDTEDLAKMPIGRPTAMCIVPWVPERLAGWVRAVDAEILGDGRDWQLTTSAGQGLDPVVVRGMESITLLINHSNTIKAGYEKRDVVSALLALHDAGYELPAEAIQSWALGHGWRAQNANHLADYCAQINRGSRPRFTGAGALRPDIVALWRDEVA